MKCMEEILGRRCYWKTGTSCGPQTHHESGQEVKEWKVLKSWVPAVADWRLISKFFSSIGIDTFIYLLSFFCDKTNKAYSWLHLLLIFKLRDFFLSEAAETAGQARPVTLEATGPFGTAALFARLSLVSGRQQDGELRQVCSLYLTALLVTAHPDRNSQKTLMTPASFSMFNMQVKLLVMQRRGFDYISPGTPWNFKRWCHCPPTPPGGAIRILQHEMSRLILTFKKVTAVDTTLNTFTHFMMHGFVASIYLLPH